MATICAPVEQMSWTETLSRIPEERSRHSFLQREPGLQNRDAIFMMFRGPQALNGSFEAIIDYYDLKAPGLVRLALIVRSADVKGQESVAAKGIGLRAIAEGFAAMQLSDEERLAHGFPIYDALYEYARRLKASRCVCPTA